MAGVDDVVEGGRLTFADPSSSSFIEYQVNSDAAAFSETGLVRSSLLLLLFASSVRESRCTSGRPSLGVW
jgi:hypothetical protein